MKVIHALACGIVFGPLVQIADSIIFQRLHVDTSVQGGGLLCLMILDGIGIAGLTLLSYRGRRA